MSGPVLRNIVAVLGSGRGLAERDAAAAAEVGRWLAEKGFHLLTGGGAGVMAAVAKGFCSVPHAGVSVGILPAGKDPGTYPNPFVEVAIRTHLEGHDPKGPGSRNHINVRTADAIVVFAGSAGTRAELELALERFGRDGRDPRDASDRMIVVLREGQDVGGLAKEAIESLGLRVVGTSGEAIAFLADRIVASWQP